MKDNSVDSTLYSLFLYLCTCTLNLLLSFREQTGVILLRSVEAALIALCGDTLSAKQRGLFHIQLISITSSDRIFQDEIMLLGSWFSVQFVFVSLQLCSDWLRATVGIRKVAGALSVEVHSKSCWKT